ncbi:MAG: hypothetical protein HGA44_07655 [Cellulomonadaceae bacterium]|nr:hypothetical protein [Cellulomonadaceae bacterium]
MTEVVADEPSGVLRASGRGGLLAVAVGLGVFGLATYGYLGLAGQALGPELFAPLSVGWSLLNAVGIGLFLPFEQELGRRTAEGRAAGAGNAAVVRQGLLAAAGLLAVVFVAGLVGHRLIADRLLAGHTELVPVLLGAMAGMAASYVVRGLLSGSGRFVHYGAQLAVDGVMRVVLAGLLLVGGVDDPLTYGIVLVVAPVAAVLLTTGRPRGLVTAGTPGVERGVVRALGVLILASALSQVLANAGPLIVQLLATAQEQAASGQFVAALVIARAPLFLFAAVQAVLLPGLAALVGAGDRDGFARRARLVGWTTGGIGALGTLGVWAVGPELVHVLFGAQFGVERGVITLIAASGGGFMLAQVAAQVLLALGGDRWVALGWAAGLGALVVACAWQGPIDLRAAWALVAGSSVAAMALGLAQHRVRVRWQGVGPVER